MRITRTKKALKEALIELLKIKTFNKITVSQICEKAYVNRVTFYTHYQDKYELYEDYLNGIKDEIFLLTKADIISYKDPKEKIKFFYQHLTGHMIDVCVKHKMVIKTFSNQDNNILVFMIEKLAMEQFALIYSEVKKIIPFKYDSSLSIPFIVGGTSKMIYSWLENDHGLSPNEFKKKLNAVIDDLMNSNFIFS